MKKNNSNNSKGQVIGMISFMGFLAIVFFICFSLYFLYIVSNSNNNSSDISSSVGSCLIIDHVRFNFMANDYGLLVNVNYSNFTENSLLVVNTNNYDVRDYKIGNSYICYVFIYYNGGFGFITMEDTGVIKSNNVDIKDVLILTALFFGFVILLSAVIYFIIWYRKILNTLKNKSGNKIQIIPGKEYYEGIYYNSNPEEVN